MQSHSSHFTFLERMAPDCSDNTTGPAFELTQEFLIKYFLTLACVILFVIPFKVHFAHILQKLPQLYTFTSIFVQLFRIGNIIIGLYWAAHECRHFEASGPKTQDNKCAKDQQQPLAVPPPKDKYLEEDQSRQTLVIQSDSSLPTPPSINQPERREMLIPPARQEIMAEVNPIGDTLISQVTPLLGITPCESTQLQSTNTPKDIDDILGTRAFQRYVDMPIQTLDGIVVNQPKHFLPLAKEARRIVEEIRIEKINEQWAGIP